MNDRSEPVAQAPAYVEPVRREVVVASSPARAFAAFTANMGSWWPKSHSINESTTQQDVVIEPRAGGRWYERGADGSQSDWGRVIAWEPPRRVLLAWQLDAEWRYDPELVTEVEVTFEQAGAGRTAIRLEHRGLERFGALGETVRGRVGGDQGWRSLLALCARFVEEN